MPNVLLQFLGGAKSHHTLRRWINFWPPFLGAGIRVKYIAPDMKSIDVEMKLRWWNANYVGTQFGGSLFAITDAFYMLMNGASGGRLHCVGQGRDHPLPHAGTRYGPRRVSSYRRAD
jgi:hypothetical protein